MKPAWTRQNAAQIALYAASMSSVLKFRPRNRVVRHDPPQRRCPIPNPRARQEFCERRPKPPVFLLLLLALALVGLASLGKEEDGTNTVARRATPDRMKSAPRSLRGGNAWNRVGGGFAGSASQTMTGRVTHVRDGDTFVVNDTPIRIANLDCAESGTLAGDLATRRAKQIVAGQIVTCRLNSQTSYDRSIGMCSLANGRDFGEIMTNEGSCRRN